MNTGMRIREVALPELELLIEMYGRFEPLGAAFGLPPVRADARRDWIAFALRRELNLAAFLPAGQAIGHCFLAGGEPGSAELAIFVRQEFRGRGVATALVKTALRWAAGSGLRRVWALASSENRAALRLLLKCGFRAANSAHAETELEIALPLVSTGDPGRPGVLRAPAFYSFEREFQTGNSRSSIDQLVGIFR